MSMQPILKSDTTKLKKTDLLGLTLPEMQQWLVERGEAPFRAKQIYNWLYQHLVADFRAMTNLPQALRDRLEQEASIGPMVARSELHSKDDRTRKVLLAHARQSACPPRPAALLDVRSVQRARWALIVT